ncbi:hypothetical protein [Deinococcus ruber]|uniref:Uncharacterized protein n=1 Tax=Deinococcus ruber TaxID=1848197 RepID=A0A918FIP3_9DEIO|nr:hypothetical protein [Deinococcus ruber]GGR40134.1 hypothetical protein GCM10008957_55880 [Deinococcus ruber]
MPAPAPLRLHPTQAAAHKAGLHLCSLAGGRTVSFLYSLLPAGEKKPIFLLSTTYKLSVAEQRWIMDHDAQATKLGRFSSGGFHPLQTKMIRTKPQPLAAE